MAEGEVKEKEGSTEEVELDEDGNPIEPKKSKKKLVLLLLIVLILGGGGAGVFFSGILTGGPSEEEQDATLEKTIYFDMDEFLVNLNNPGNKVSFLKTIITLELPNQKSMNDVQSKMPRNRDTFQIYLRELRSSDLQGSAGLQRLRTELLLRINNILEDGKVNNILFKEIIVQ